MDNSSTNTTYKDVDSATGPKVFDLNATGNSVESMGTEEQEDTKWKDIYGKVHEYLKNSKSYLDFIIVSLYSFLLTHQYYKSSKITTSRL